MSNNKFPKLAVLSLLGLLSLTSCGSSEESEIKSLPKDYNNPIVTITDETAVIHNNLVSVVADQFHDNDAPSKTLDKVLYRYAQSVFGAYNKITLPDGDTTSVTLKEAARELYSNSAEHPLADKFIRGHKVYWTFNDKGEHVDDDGKPVADDKTFAPSESELGRVTSHWEDIEKRIAENMFAKAKAGGHTTKHFFSEVDYVKSLYDAGQHVAHYKKVVEADPEVKPLIIDYTVEDDEVFSEGILHRKFYQTNFEINDEEVVGEGYDYIEKVIVPEVYGDLLIEQYLLDEESDAVKQSRARQINVIKIEKYTGFTECADYLKDELVREIYSRLPNNNETHVAYIDEDNNPYYDVFKKYEDIAKGLEVIDTRGVTIMAESEVFDPTTHNIIPEKYEQYWSPTQIIARINAQASDTFKYVEKTLQGKDYSYYEHTTYGDLVEDYDEFWSAENFDEIDTSLRNKFTSNGTVTPEEGFDQEKISLSQVETITKGWYIQKSAPTLDSNGKIKENLFQVSVANSKLEAKDQNDADVLNKLSETDRIYFKDNEWKVRPAKESKENKYLCSINGAYFLKFDGNYAGSQYVNDIVYDDGSAYYICQVIEAAKDVKLRNAEYENSYAKTRKQGFLESVISEITTKVAETGSYASLSKEYWLEKMNITYHDQKVYDYFKSNYPDLF